MMIVTCAEFVHDASRNRLEWVWGCGGSAHEASSIVSLERGLATAGVPSGGTASAMLTGAGLYEELKELSIECRLRKMRLGRKTQQKLKNVPRSWQTHIPHTRSASGDILRSENWLESKKAEDRWCDVRSTSGGPINQFKHIHNSMFY